MDYPCSIFNENTKFQKSKLIRQIHDLKKEKNKIIADKNFLCGSTLGCFIRSILISFIFVVPIKFFTGLDPIFSLILFTMIIFIFLSLILKVFSSRISILNKVQRNYHRKISHILKKANYKRLFHGSNFLQKKIAPFLFQQTKKKLYFSKYNPKIIL